MKQIIRSLNELEKLKLLLFDDNQLFLFEHIPKPFLVNPQYKIDSQMIKNVESSKTASKIDYDFDYLFQADNYFWKKAQNQNEIVQRFNSSIEAIRKKGDKINIIDEKLFLALNIPLPQKTLIT